MWIEVTAEYGQVEVYGSGVWDQTTGTFAEDPQVRTYRAVAEDFDDKATFHLLRNNHWLEDTRIPPLGLQPNLDTDPVTDRYVLGGDGAWPNYDTVTYSFAAATEVTDATPADTNDDVLNVRVRLLYLINSREYIEFLADENSTNEAGNFVAMLFDTAGGATPLVLAEEAIEVPIVGFTDVAGTGSSDETTGAPMTSGTGADGTTGSSTAMDDSGDTTGGPPQTEGGDGCGCRNASPTAAGWALLIAGLLGRRRSPRRRLRRP
jgi:hypothetical protein